MVGRLALLRPWRLGEMVERMEAQYMKTPFLIEEVGKMRLRARFRGRGLQSRSVWRAMVGAQCSRGVDVLAVEPTKAVLQSCVVGSVAEVRPIPLSIAVDMLVG